MGIGMMMARWVKGYYTYRDHWLQMFDDWDDERITWGILHRYPGSYNSETGVYTWYYYPLRDSVYVNREEAPYEGIEPYQKQTSLLMAHILALVSLNLRL